MMRIRRDSAAMKSRFCSTRIIVRPLLVAQPLQDLDDLVDDRGLDTLGRLVEQDETRFAAKAARERQQLLLAARQRAAGPLEQRLEARKFLEHFVNDLLLAAVLLGAAHAQIVVDREAGENLAPLRHIAEPQPRTLIRLGGRHVVAVEADESRRSPAKIPSAP